MNLELEQKYLKLQEIMRGYDSAIVAFSGGIDSSLVALALTKCCRRIVD